MATRAAAISFNVNVRLGLANAPERLIQLWLVAGARGHFWRGKDVSAVNKVFFISKLLNEIGRTPSFQIMQRFALRNATHHKGNYQYTTRLFY